MRIKTVGLITYHHPHLKTEQVLQRILNRYVNIRIYALPFKARAPRETLFSHRPEQTNAVPPQTLAEKHGLEYIECINDTDIDEFCDVYLVMGAGILSPECIQGKRIINCHPGILPASRGLDAFKWILYEMKPLGVTLHYIDEHVDAGKIISVVPTNVYVLDSLHTLARRHYENEIDCLSRFSDFLDNPHNPFADIEGGEPKRRMPISNERELARCFSDYAKIYGKT